MIISSTNVFILQHPVHTNFKKQSKFKKFNTNLADVAILKSAHSAPNNPERNDERHRAPISFIWVEC